MVESISKALQAPQVNDMRSPSNRMFAERQPASEVQARERRDTLEISSRAEELQNAEKTPRLQEIQNQMYSGFYNSPSVIREAASRMTERIFPNLGK